MKDGGTKVMVYLLKMLHVVFRDNSVQHHHHSTMTSFYFIDRINSQMKLIF
jgi:hypothetical protein